MITLLKWEHTLKTFSQNYNSRRKNHNYYQKKIPDHLTDAIISGKSFLLSCHRNPDGDAIGSMMAMALALIAMNKEVTIYNVSPIPYNFYFLPETHLCSQSILADKTFDIAMSFDSPLAFMMGEEFLNASSNAQLLNVDHHINNELYGTYNWIDTEASAVGVMVYKILRKLDVDLNLDMASCIYCSIITDTGSFRYGSTNEEAMRVAGKLLSIGVDPWYMAKNIYESHPIERLTLMADTMKTLTISAENRVATLTINHSTFMKNKGDLSLIDGIINFPRSIRGIEIAILFYEFQPGMVGISIRSKGNVNVTEIGKLL